MPDNSPQSLGRYSLHAELGRGGFATVYRATDSALEREVALKVLKPGWTDDAKAVERFMREAKQAARLKHPNNVTIRAAVKSPNEEKIDESLIRHTRTSQIRSDQETKGRT